MRPPSSPPDARAIRAALQEIAEPVWREALADRLAPRDGARALDLQAVFARHFAERMTPERFRQEMVSQAARLLAVARHIDGGA